MSIKKIAEKAGVSISTVSRILNRPDYKCSVPGLREKVWSIAMVMNYVPNEAARNLKKGTQTKESKIWYINVLMTRTDESRTDPFFTELLRVVESEIHEHNCILSKVWYMPFFSDDRKCRRENLDQIIQRMEPFYSSQVRPTPGLEKFLSILKMEGVWMYVATATHRRLTEKALKTAGIDHYFRGIVTSADAGNHKSESADIYEMAMRRLQSNKRDTVVFEDALHAIRTAKAAGFRVAGVYEATAEQDQPEIQRLCDYYIRSYEELVQSETF